MPTAPPKLLDRIRERVRVKHYTLLTEEAYVGWIKRFILFHDKRHRKDMRAAEVTAFLTHLAVEGKEASTQTQALQALHFPHRKALGIELPWLDNVTRSKRPHDGQRDPLGAGVPGRGEVAGCMPATAPAYGCWRG